MIEFILWKYLCCHKSYLDYAADDVFIFKLSMDSVVPKKHLSHEDLNKDLKEKLPAGCEVEDLVIDL